MKQPPSSPALSTTNHGDSNSKDGKNSINDLFSVVEQERKNMRAVAVDHVYGEASSSSITALQVKGLMALASTIEPSLTAKMSSARVLSAVIHDDDVEGDHQNEHRNDDQETDSGEYFLTFRPSKKRRTLHNGTSTGFQDWRRICRPLPPPPRLPSATEAAKVTAALTTNIMNS